MLITFAKLAISCLFRPAILSSQTHKWFLLSVTSPICTKVSLKTTRREIYFFKFPILGHIRNFWRSMFSINAVIGWPVCSCIILISMPLLWCKEDVLFFFGYSIRIRFSVFSVEYTVITFIHVELPKDQVFRFRDSAIGTVGNWNIMIFALKSLYNRDIFWLHGIYQCL